MTNHRDLRLALALHGQLTRLGASGVLASAVVHAAGHDDLPARRGGLETSGRGDHVADCREVLDIARADVAHKGGPEVESDAELHPWPVLAVARGGQQRPRVGDHVVCGLAGEDAWEVGAITWSPTSLSMIACSQRTSTALA